MLIAQVSMEATENSCVFVQATSHHLCRWALLYLCNSSQTWPQKSNSLE